MSIKIPRHAIAKAYLDLTVRKFMIKPIIMSKEKTDAIMIDSIEMCVLCISTTVFCLQRTTVLVKAKIQNGHLGRIAKIILPINPKLNFDFNKKSFLQALQSSLIYGSANKS
jgi:hypothetical protein